MFESNFKLNMFLKENINNKYIDYLKMNSLKLLKVYLLKAEVGTFMLS